ncbi:oleosin L-like [Nymphaea colorata]|uniref:Oleosin n=1 Tax=Nymphaea colorata TaxID=210225 RepID=A0A5K0YM12_9MAGN|nr:oleosin L-like [Nymphaea colorata]VVV78044.1 unnamed protein product [Nymphaea colorata]
MAERQADQRTQQVVKVVTAVTIGGSLTVLSGLSLGGTVVALTVATPLLILFSPVLVPAAIAAILLVLGFLSSGGFAAAAVSVFAWAYRYATGKRPPGAEGMEAVRGCIAGKAREAKERAERFAHHVHGRAHEAASH